MELRALGDYLLIKSIGQGSLGAVFLAEHRFMKKHFILKVLPEELAADRSFIQRFEEDISALATLEHPNIVKIHHVSFSQGQYFLVLDCIVDEFGETKNLYQYLLSLSKSLTEEEIYRFLKQIAEALDYAHQKKSNGKPIIHRNLKLNNILINKGKNGIDLCINDFGLSRIIGTGAVLSKTLKVLADSLSIAAFGKLQERYPNPPIESQKLATFHQSFLQNLAFLAPEQKKGDGAAPIDTKVDTYAFGILTYYLLLHEFPEGVFEMPNSKREDLKWNWDDLIHQCLRYSPENRPEFLMPALEQIRILEKKPFKSFFINEEREYALAAVSEDLEENRAKRPILNSPQLERPNFDLDPAAAMQVDTTVKQYCPEVKEVKNLQPIDVEMVVIEGGTFYRGSNDGNRDEMPKHQISLSNFAIDIHPVTNDQFVRFLEVMGGEKDNNHNDIIRLRDSRIKRTAGKLSIESGYAKHPVVGVTWYGAIAYAKWVGKRLPTEAEWEIASSCGKDNLRYPSGDDIEKSQANFFSADTTAVMSYAPNRFGLYDMAGNVYEWCYDWYGYNYYEVSIQEPENPSGPVQGVYRVLRGGCWKSLKEDLRCSRRHRNNPGAVNGTYGFRCAADVR